MPGFRPGDWIRAPSTAVLQGGGARMMVPDGAFRGPVVCAGMAGSVGPDGGCVHSVVIFYRPWGLVPTAHRKRSLRMLVVNCISIYKY